MWEILSGSSVFIEVTVVKHISHLFIIRQKVFVETVFWGAELLCLGYGGSKVKPHQCLMYLDLIHTFDSKLYLMDGFWVLFENIFIDLISEIWLAKDLIQGTKDLL